MDGIQVHKGRLRCMDAGPPQTDDIPPDLDFGVALGDSVMNADESELPEPQDMATSVPTSQGREFKTPELPRAKKPKLPPKAMGLQSGAP